MSSSEAESDVWEPDSPVAPKKKVTATTKAPAKKKAADGAPKKKVAAGTAKKPAAKKPAVKKPAAVKPKKKKKSAYSDEDDEDDDDDDPMDGESDVDPIQTTPQGKKQSIEQIYQKKTQLEHILLRPDTYIGSIEPITQSMWVFDDKSKKMENRKITYTPGLYKIFDEIIVNASDNKQRDKTMDTLKVDINIEEGSISVWNNGKGIPVAMHKEHKVYVPEMIFGHLLTGSNFDDNKKKTVGGRNGYGAKLANIFSKEFTVETADQSTKQRYKQIFSNNMSNKGTPAITPWSKKDYTCITFKPDLERFKMSQLDDDIVSLFKKRVYDVAGVTDKTLKVYLNGEQISIKSFADYVDLYKPSGASKKKKSDDEEDGDDNEDSGDGEGSNPTSENTVIFDKADSRWQVGVGLSDDGFQQISFVNGICTTKGGQHVNYIADQVVNKLVAVLKKKNKGETVKPNYIKNHMTVYVTALIDNPAFDSQTKETLTTRPPAFGSTYTLSDKFLKQIEKSGMVERILSFAQYKQTAELRRKGGGGVKKSKLTGITKLDDANNAGTSKAHNCTLILTEGDSAKSLAISGLAVVGRDNYGVFPLKGKLLNVREASHTQILKNEEIQNLVKIMGLKYGQKYDSTKSLRYGHLMIMADQDHDGSHIKGLVINFIHHFWPSLLEIEGFLQEFITPIVKCTKGHTKKVFYTMPEYETWREATNYGRGWSIKYYKGLGTSTAQEAKEYFSDLQTHQIGFVYEGDADGDSIDMAFSKKRVEERKDWLRGFETGTHVDYDVEEMAYTEFVNKELILFSMADNLRSIPSLVDGFKPSQRKVLFSCFKRNLKVEIKVAQLAGYVSEHSAYHHGEQSLQGTIVNMAQDFVGSNNIHLLSPNGQFGTRLLGGKDAASARYIFTNLEALARRLFDTLDNDNLKYLDEDGQSIEPEWYVPIIPMVLVNGSEGIGTGWSSSIPNYNPLDVIRNIRHKLKGEELEQLVPWYRGFKGPISEKTTGKTTDTFIVQGLYEIPDESTLVITELPVKTWTHSYKQFLETLVEAGTVKDFRENHTDTTVLFTISMEPATLRDIGNAPGGIIKKFKLETSISTSNMHLFDARGRIKKYETPLEILDEFFEIRLDFYERRKASMLAKLAEQVKILSNKARFILAVVKGELVLSNRKKDDVLRQLVKDGYDQMTPSGGAKSKTPSEEGQDGSDDDGSDSEATALTAKGYEYLLSMKLMSLTKERVEKLQSELKAREQEYSALELTAIEDLWISDLDNLEQLYNDNEAARELMATSVPAKKKGGSRRKPAPKRAKKRKASSDDDEDSEFEVAAKPKIKQRTEDSSKVVTKLTVKKPVVKKEALKTEPVSAKEKPISSFFTKEPKKEVAPVKKEEKKEDLEELSLAERLARRIQDTPPKAKPVKKNLVNLASSESDDEPPKQRKQAQDDESDDDVFAMDAGKKKTAAKSNGTAKPAKVTAKATSKSESVAVPKPKVALKRKKDSATEPVKPAAKKRKQESEDEDDEDDDDDAADPSPMKTPPRRPTRVRKTIVYHDLSSDEDDEDEGEEDAGSGGGDHDADDGDSDVEMVEPTKKAKPAAAKPKPKPKKRAADSDEEDEDEDAFSEAEEDEEDEDESD